MEQADVRETEVMIANETKETKQKPALGLDQLHMHSP
jgi:hypothetical protein